MEAGAEIVNDVTGVRQPAMREVVRESRAGAIIMHMQGTPADMQRAPRYENVVAEIREFFRQTLTACVACGMDPLRLAFDPGIGFGKTLEHNLSLIRNLGALRVEDRPLVLGASRKSFHWQGDRLRRSRGPRVAHGGAHQLWAGTRRERIPRA